MSRRLRWPPRRSWPPASPNAAPVRIPPSRRIRRQPPDAVASASGRRAPLGIGSFCWPADGDGPSACIDRSGIITATDALVADRGETIIVTGPDLPWRTLREASVRVPPATGEPERLEREWLAWFPGGPSAALAASPRTDAVAFRADLEAGRWVVDVFLRFDAGDVSYGLLLEMR